MSVKQGDTIKVDYTGTLEDGTVFDSSQKRGEPLEFQVGSGQLIKGFDEAVIGMKEGEEKTITLAPADAYGERNDQLKQTLPRETIPADMDPKPGMMVAVQAPDGRQMPAQVITADDKEVVIDLNHPLAGKKLNFQIKLVGTN